MVAKTDLAVAILWRARDLMFRTMTANGMVRPCSRPACSECWQGAPKTGARHVTETRQLARRNRHRYRQELVPHRWPKSARCRRAAAEMVAWAGGGPARQSAAVSDRHGGLRRRASPQSHAK